jgi:hypothetical protein
LTVDDEEKLKLGKGVAFVKSRWKRLPQGDDTWEADFEALPKPIMQRKGGKTAQRRNRDERAARSRPTFHRATPRPVGGQLALTSSAAASCTAS